MHLHHAHAEVVWISGVANAHERETDEPNRFGYRDVLQP